MDPIRCRQLIKSKLLFVKQQNLRLSTATCQRNFQKVVEKLLSTHLKIPPEGRAEEEEEVEEEQEMKESQITWERLKATKAAAAGAGCF